MNYIEKMLLNYLLSSKIKMEISGFDMLGFEKALHQELRRRLDTIEYIAFADDGIMSNEEKLESIKNVFQQQ